MKFSPIIKESLKEYVDSEKQKEKFSKNVDCCYIENIIRKLPKIKNKKENLDKIEQNYEQNMIKIRGKDKYNFKSDFDENPFKSILIGGGLAEGIIKFDITNILVGLIASSGIGLIICLIAVGIYKIFSLGKGSNDKEFFKNFKSDKMKVEREIQSLAISKIEHYFNKYISIEDRGIKLKYDESEKYINNIIDIYIEKDNNNLDSLLLELDLQDILDKLINDVKILSKNISKIREEIIKTILSTPAKNLKDIFNSSVPLFIEFIKIFGPSNIDKKTEKKIDLNIAKIVSIMRDILNEKMDIALKEFKLATYIKSFEIDLMKKYEEKKQYDYIEEKDFTDKCNDYIIEPVGKNAMYYGIIFLFFKFAVLIQDIGSKKKLENYKQNEKNIKKKFLLSINLYFNKKEL